MGHALNASIQDALVRWHRMRGFNALWQPGYDHAGIATQAVVERELAKEGLTRRDLGREKFVERTWEWLERYGGRGMGPLPRLGASLHYPRQRVTLHPGYVRAVLRRVDPAFGTGALKITPGHDPTDWEIGRDHDLPELMVIGLDARMNDEAGQFAGLTQQEANERIVARLEEDGLLEAKEHYRHAVAY